MINILRNSIAPDSLSTPEIRQYLDQLEAYYFDQELPIDQRTLSKPTCTETYRNSDLLEAFDDYFFSKCYLTEKKFITSWAMDVEHFIPRNKRPDLTYHWENLFPADHDANMMKPRKNPTGGYLNPCDPHEDVEKDILYFIDFEDNSVHFEASDRSNIKAVNTAKLLQKIHNGDSTETHRKTIELREAIRKKYIHVLETIIKWQNARLAKNSQDEFKHERKLQGLLSRKNAFTMLIRSVEAVKILPDYFFD